MSVLLDAGPVLNFLAVGQENVLIQYASARNMQLAAPERVNQEVLGMSRSPRFNRTGVERKWKTLTSSRISLLDDSVNTTEFVEAIERVSDMPVQARLRDRKSLGELLVIAHASVMAQAGKHATVLIDDGEGLGLAKREKKWLEVHSCEESLELVSSVNVLRAADPGWIMGQLGWEKVYDRMCTFDDGLRPRR